MHVTDISNAARTNWMDIGTGRWHPETMAHFGTSEEMLPEIRSNAEVYGCDPPPERRSPAYCRGIAPEAVTLCSMSWQWLEPHGAQLLLGLWHET